MADAVRETTGAWPALPLESWRDTYATLHRWTQIVGKICLARTPRLNHFWNVAFQVTPRGLATPCMVHRDRAFGIVFDFVDHRLVIDSAAETRSIPLEPRTVADMYRRILDTLRDMDLPVRIWSTPVEIPEPPVRFEDDVEHRAYDPASARAFWRILVASRPVFEDFRGEFLGKSSPVHFFWGGFDLASTRFSGRRAPERPGADAVQRESYSHEVISHGFWPGGGTMTEPVFYAYAAPEPEGFRAAPVEPAAAYWSSEWSEFFLPYEAVRTSASPERDLMAFLRSTYARGADLGRWNRAELERSPS